MTRIKGAGWAGGVAAFGLAVALGCAGMHGGSASAGNPTAQRAEASQAQSQEALEKATEAQKKAADQGKKAAQAQAEVQKAQQALTKAQETARQEQEKAEQLQHQANQATQEASQTAQTSQQAASQALSEQGTQVQRSEQVTAGQVTTASADRLAVRTPDGSTMAFRVTDQTRVLLDGAPASAGAIPPGADAHVTYRVSAGEPLAVRVQVATGSAGSFGSGGSGKGGEDQGSRNSGSGY